MAKSYELSVSVENDIAEIVITGEAGQDTPNEVMDEVYDILLKLNPKALLIDIRDIKGRMGIIETYYHVRSHPLDARIWVAIVDLPEHYEYLSFYENTALNAGFLFKSFTSIDRTRAWLKGKVVKD